MSEKIIYIIRHCEKPEDEKDKNLSPIGQQHAAIIGKFFNDKIKPKPLDSVACFPSTLLTEAEVHGTANRAYQTADAVMNALDLSSPTTHVSWIPGSELEVARYIRTHNAKWPLVVAWEHDHIPSLCQNLGFPQVKTWSGKNPEADTKPDGNEFSVCYQLELTHHTFSFFPLPLAPK